MSGKHLCFIVAMLFSLLLGSACNNQLTLVLPTTTPVVETSSTDTTANEAITATLTTTRPLTESSAGPATETVSETLAVTATSVVTTTAATASVPFTATGQPGAILAAELIEVVAIDDINLLSAGFYPADNLVDAQYAVAIYRLTIESSDEVGTPLALQADLFIPQVATATTFPVFGYAPGTTGMGDRCAPSQEYPLGRRWGDYRTHMLSYSGQGLIGILPDGLSYGDPNRPHEYFIAELEAHSLLDAARAAYGFFTDAPAEILAQPQNALFFGGYSNGGHTAFAAKDFAAEYAPELPLQGVISHGATTNVEALLRESPIFTPYLIYAYRHFFGAEVIGPEDVFLTEWLPTFDEDVMTRCVDDIYVYYTNDPAGMYRPEFRAALFDGTLGAAYPLFKAVVDANYAGTFGGFAIPAAFFQGSADYVVTPESQQRFATFLCEQGEPVTYVTLPAIQHVNTRQASFKATLAWIQGIAAGEIPQSDCAQLTTEAAP
ncbi:MAG: hypothetical protein KF832_20390 [Caldilineaceae bacterium]|nr:hypothetical protein [Caldilineaceae bacterium]